MDAAVPWRRLAASSYSALQADPVSTFRIQDRRRRHLGFAGVELHAADFHRRHHAACKGMSTSFVILLGKCQGFFGRLAGTCSGSYRRPTNCVAESALVFPAGMNKRSAFQTDIYSQGGLQVNIFDMDVWRFPAVSCVGRKAA